MGGSMRGAYAMSPKKALSEYEKKLSEIELSINADPSRAKDELAELRRRAESANQPESLLYYCDLLMGRCMQRRGFYNEAFDLISKSTRLLDSLGAAREAATGYHYLAQINSSRHDMQLALECCMRGQELARRINDQYLLMNLIIDTGPVNRSLGEISASLAAFKKGLEIYYKHVKGKDSRIAGQEEYTEFLITLNLAIQHFNLREYDKAKEYLDGISGLAERVLGGAYVDIYNLEYGRICFAAGLNEEGVARADIVIERLEADEQRSLHGSAINYVSLCRDLIHLNELDRAKRLFALIRPQIERENSSMGMRVFSLALAEYHTKAGEKDEAIRFYQEHVRYVDLDDARVVDENIASVKRRMELQSVLESTHAAEAEREREIERMQQQMSYNAERNEILDNISENTDSFFLLYTPETKKVDFVSLNSKRLFGFDVKKNAAACVRLLKKLNIDGETTALFLCGELVERVSTDCETVNPATGETMTIHIEIIPSHNRPYILVLNDITQIMRTQASLITATKAAQQASEAKTSFLSNMSHDIRTPMSIIVGLLDMLRDNIDDRAAALNYIDKIQKSSEHLLSLINDILDMSRIEEGRMTLSREAFVMPEFLQSVVSVLLSQAAMRSQSLTLEIDNIDDSSLIGDPLRLRQVFFNILGNALKFTPSGGSIILRATRTESDGAGARFKFEFSDTGCGMTQEFQTKLFNRFERAENEVRSIEGTGLGMAITKSLVDMMGGAITVTSELGAGTVFTVELYFEYMSDTDAARQAARVAESTRGRGKGAVLLVEDNAINVEIASYMLRKLGCTVITASDGKQACELLEQSKPNDVSLVFLDIRMPVMNGYDAARRIRASSRRDIATIPIAAMTADAFDEDIKKALDAGMDAHIAKPLDITKLAALLARLL